jgi:hypothetical protein
MKINEIASRRLDEAPPVVKYVGSYFDKAAAAAAKLFGAGKGTTQAELDALRAGETGAVKAAGERPLSTVSKDELNALLYPPVTPAPTVGSFLKRRGDQGFDPDLSKPQALPGYLQNLPPARIVPVTRPSPSGPRPRPRPATELGNMEPDLQASPAAAELGQLRPGVETPTSAAVAPAASDTVTLPRDIVDRIMRMAERDPAAAQAAAEKAGIPWYIPSKGGLALGTAGGLALGGLPPAINAVSPGTIPDWANPSAYATKGAEKVLAPRPLPPEDRIQRVAEPETDRSKSSNSSDSAPVPNAAPSSGKDSSDKVADDDPELQELLKDFYKGKKVDESTAALNRMVYLSRL